MHDLDDHSATITTVEACEELILRRLEALGFDRTYRVAFCAPQDDLQVVRIIVPRVEFFTEAISRVGVRLRDHAQATA